MTSFLKGGFAAVVLMGQQASGQTDISIPTADSAAEAWAYCYEIGFFDFPVYYSRKDDDGNALLNCNSRNTPFLIPRENACEVLGELYTNADEIIKSSPPSLLPFSVDVLSRGSLFSGVRAHCPAPDG